ncbi:hypothetical protein CVT26_012330 [Gymnopilus dilepis]|uniref:Uncharacterized protein n=1 Tax=Gymnopilus dilepis TaxID=231916 RepID=A0A409YC95_9AGAR|nr:hypothetical protein CVT26_012330 [Gymnopilus dilepis]
MAFRKIPREIKIAAIQMYQANLLPLAIILDFLDFSYATFYRAYGLWLKTGDVVRHRHVTQGRKHLMHFSNIEYLKRIIRHHPDWFLDELAYLLETNRFIAANFTTVHWELVRAGISTKKIKKVASERNDDLRADFIRHMADYSPEQLGFLDEV